MSKAGKLDCLFLIKPGEILLKQGNQDEFIRRLIGQIRARMSPIPCEIHENPGRFFLSTTEEGEKRARFVLSRCPGLNGYAKATSCPKQPSAIFSAAVRAAAEASGGLPLSFKVETRRSDKSFPLGSYETSAAAGESILHALPSLWVNVRNPDFVINIEIREKAYVYGKTERGLRGLPTASSGKALVLLSGGIDSPVAAHLMAKRGLSLEFAHFHTYPYTSIEAQHKVERLATRLTAYTGTSRLWMIPFTDIQREIKKGAPEDYATIMLRSAMMAASGILARRIGAQAVVTGESLGQVASQTIENMRVTQAATEVPVLRPLVGLDKEDTIGIAKDIGTFGISILPFEDCCVLFSPKHPVLKPDFDAARAIYESLALGSMIEAAVDGAQRSTYGFGDALADFEAGE
ncbi:MAG TPA: tRNA uracil 4-sulfurtransferase ThiI [Rectinemataceae bacterium]